MPLIAFGVVSCARFTFLAVTHRVSGFLLCLCFFHTVRCKWIPNISGSMVRGGDLVSPTRVLASIFDFGPTHTRLPASLILAWLASTSGSSISASTLASSISALPSGSSISASTPPLVDLCRRLHLDHNGLSVLLWLLCLWLVLS